MKSVLTEEERRYFDQLEENEEAESRENHINME